MAEIKYFLNANDAPNFLKIKTKFMRNINEDLCQKSLSLSKALKEDKSLTRA